MSSYGNQVIETFLQGKCSNQELCEDACYLGSRYVAVVDGVTAKGHLSYAGKTSGRFAAEVLVKAFQQLDHSEEGRKPLELLACLDKALEQAKDDYALTCGITIGIEDYPRASVIYYDRERKEVIAYGDCQCRIGDEVFTHAKRIDEKLSQIRSRILNDRLKDGATIDELRKSDPGRAAIHDDLLRQFEYENVPGEFGYPVLNGRGICSEMVVVHEVQPGQSVVLCSDGYPVVCATLEESEQELKRVLSEDPLFIWEHPSTKGWNPSNDSYDDRVWVRL